MWICIVGIFEIPRVVLVNKESFEAFNFYRSTAWKIKGVDNPLLSMSTAGNENLYSYRYDWDDHRRLVVANFQSLIGAAHATEIPILTGNYDLVGGYPLSDLIYPPSFSKRYTSKNMMRFWTNFAKFGVPGSSTNSVEWKNYLSNDGSKNYLIIDKRKNLKMISESFKFFIRSVIFRPKIEQLEKCVVLLQMYTYVGETYMTLSIKYVKKLYREESENFIKDNASFIEF